MEDDGRGSGERRGGALTKVRQERGLPDAGRRRSGAAHDDRELCSAQPPRGKGSVAPPRNVIYITTTPCSKRGCGLEIGGKPLTQRCW